MILPSKHLAPSRSLLSIGGDLLGLLKEPKTVSGLWDLFQSKRQGVRGEAPITYEWFTLAVDFLFIVGALEHRDGLLRIPAQ